MDKLGRSTSDEQRSKEGLFFWWLTATIWSVDTWGWEYALRKVVNPLFASHSNGTGPGVRHLSQITIRNFGPDSMCKITVVQLTTNNNRILRQQLALCIDY